ncbi:MAG TPA: Lrp/AsnC family transcriptional regulator [Telluria sp.]|nr:Lrp/AsnC family transcriptional regulator [Telluria sp.]
MAIELDRTDIQILNILQEDATTPLREPESFQEFGADGHWSFCIYPADAAPPCPATARTSR